MSHDVAAADDFSPALRHRQYVILVLILATPDVVLVRAHVRLAFMGQEVTRVHGNGGTR
jgi:hypothetical protein